MAARILLIEDDQVSLDLMTYLLTAYGHTVLQAMNGREGVERAHAELLDLILCDNQMPLLGGADVAQILKSEPATRAIPLVSVTASAMTGDRAKILAAGFDGYVAKPITPETFVAEIDAFLPADRRSSASRR